MSGFPPSYAEALRSELERRVRRAARPAWRRPRVILVTAGVALALVMGGAVAGAAAGFIVLPGAPSIVRLGKPVTEQHQGSATVDLGTAPAGATNIAVNFSCLSVGRFTLGDGSSISCGAADVGQDSSATLPLAAGQHSTSVTTSARAWWRLSAAYVNSTTTPWAINAHGQSYGVANEHGSPDLIAVQTSDGRDGYVFATQLADADGTTASEHFTSPAEALAWQRKMAGKTVRVPVYLSDGSTRIGDFVMTYPPLP